MQKGERRGQEREGSAWVAPDHKAHSWDYARVGNDLSSFLQFNKMLSDRYDMFTALSLRRLDAKSMRFM